MALSSSAGSAVTAWPVLVVSHDRFLGRGERLAERLWPGQGADAVRRRTDAELNSDADGPTERFRDAHVMRT